MAASNYYAGYTSGAQHSQGFTQVQNPPIQTSYTAPQGSTGYAVQGTAPTAAHYGPPQTQAPRQVVQQADFSAASSAYAQTAPTQGSAYGYTARQQDAPPPPPPTNTAYQAASHAAYQSHPASQSYYERDAYENKATYYSQQPVSSVQVSQGAYYAQGATATAKAAYQVSAATAYPTPVSATRAAAKSHPVQAYTSSSTVAYPYSTARTHTNYNNQGSYSTSNYGSSNTAATESYHPQAYEAAVYNAAAAYVQQQQQHQAPSRPNWKNKGGGMGGMSSNKQQKPKAPPKQQQIHYCDICKISCAGPQTYKEHLEGQKHKKKEAAGKAKPDTSANNSNCYQCELCNITCTGADAYAAHLKGSKHQKVVNLHVKMGRPIPEIQPIKPPETKDDDKTKSAPNNRNNRKAGAKRTAAPKITFVGGTKLTTTGIVKSDSATDGAATQNQQQAGSKEDESMEASTEGEEKFDLATFTGVDKSKIVGSEYLEEVKSDDGKVTSFHCKLCECKFNDPNAKEAHLAGRRHRLQYKKKVQPDLVVETKPSNRRLSKSQEEKLRHRWEQEQMWRWRRDEDARWHEEEARRWEEEEYHMRRMEEERIWEEEHRRRYEAEFHDWNDRSPAGGHPATAVPPRLMDAPPGMPHMRPRYNSPDDQMVMAKHSAIYPTEAELQAVQNIVSASEKALKFVSDVISEQDNPQMEVDATTEGEKEETPAVKKEPEAEVKTSEPAEASAEKTDAEAESEPKEPAKPQAPRALKGVMRVGVLAKGLLLRGRLDVNLVVLCHNKPSMALLKRVTDLLPAQLSKLTEEKYDIKMEPEESAIKISTTTEPKVVVTVTLTSPIMRDTVEPTPAEDEPDVLDRQKCLDALAALRHAKWFQAKANSLQSCVVIIRVMREMCQRVPAFSPISEWALELLVEKSLSSSDQPLGPGEAFRRVLECISSGLFQEGGPGLCDPCEKEHINAAAEIKSQEAEDLTAAAQHALRLQAFRQLHKVLGIDPPPPAPRYRGRYPRGGRFKRRREDSGQGDEGAKKEKKEGEGEGTSEVMDTSSETKDAAPKPVAKADA